MGSSENDRDERLVRTQRNFDNPLVELCRVAGRSVGTPTTVLIFGNGKRRVLMGVGLERIPSNTPLELICRHTHRAGRLIVQNAPTDERFRSNKEHYPANCPSYLLAVPVYDKKLQVIGVLCAMDTNPRPANSDVKHETESERDIESLQIVARQIALQWDMRRGDFTPRPTPGTFRTLNQRTLVEDRNLSIAAQWISEDRLRAALAGSSDGLFDCELMSGYIYYSPRLVELLGYAPGGANIPRRLIELRSLIHPDDRAAAESTLLNSVQHGRPFRLEFRIRLRSGEYGWLEVRAAVLPDEQGIPHRLAGCVTDIGPRKRAEHASLEREEIYRQAISAAEGVVYHLDFQTNTYAYMGEGIEKLIGYPASQVTPDLWPRIAKPYRYQGSLAPETYKRVGQELRCGRLSEWNADYEVTLPNGQTRWIADRAVLVTDSDSHIPGCIGILQDVTERVLAQRQTEVQFARITALRAIDITILTSESIEKTLQIVLDQIPSHLQIDAAAALLLDTEGKQYAPVASIGLPNTFSLAPIHAENDPVGRRLVQELSVTDSDLQEAGDLNIRREEMRSQGFSDYFAIPLISQGRVSGAIELFHRDRMIIDPDWKDFLYALAGQASIAIETHRLVCGLRRTNEELAQAYDTTIEGWAQALDYRDKETEGHTRRVTELTMRLASAMGFDRKQLINIRRGALLHDIGKMAIPDRILLKPGPLTDEEMEEMKKHTQYAHNLLAPIPFLKEALDIPYCHHEWWNGAGYPQGLQGEQIPLAARLFAVIDVYDALRSDRPYRSAWPEDRVRKHILEASGSHFDPGIVTAFLELLRKDDGEMAWPHSQAVA